MVSRRHLAYAPAHELSVDMKDLATSIPLGILRDMEEGERLKASLVERLFGKVATAQGAGEGGPVALSAAIPEGANIRGVGYGAKSTMGQVGGGGYAVRVYVRKKLPRFKLTRKDEVPPKIDGVPTDVIEVGDPMAYLECGASVGVQTGLAGTLGCLVRRTGDDGTFILSNSHILALQGAAPIGTPILQPAPLDGGTQRIATLAVVVPFSGGANVVDCALARLDHANSVDPTITEIGRIQNPPVPASNYQSVRKFGRTTQHTVGIIMGLSEALPVRYGNQMVHFQNQLAIVGVGSQAFSDHGDSGSLIVDAVGRQPVGLLFAGGGETTFANKIGDVITGLGISAFL